MIIPIPPDLVEHHQFESHISLMRKIVGTGHTLTPSVMPHTPKLCRYQWFSWILCCKIFSKCYLTNVYNFLAKNINSCCMNRDAIYTYSYSIKWLHLSSHIEQKSHKQFNNFPGFQVIISHLEILFLSKSKFGKTNFFLSKLFLKLENLE